MLVLAAAPASADLYKWVDERGATVLSNVPPPNPKRVTNFEVVVKESTPPPTRASAQQHDVTATEKLLLDRIDTLERQVQAQQQSARETAIVAAPPSEPYYPAPAYADAYGYPGYYPSWVFPYPPGYFWGYPPTSSVVIGSRFGQRGGGVRSFPPYSSAARIVSYPASFSTSPPTGTVVIGGGRR